MITDPIADMLTRLRNASSRRFSTVQIPASRFKEAVAELLVREGWIEKSELIKPETGHTYLLLTLKYSDNQPVIRGLTRISKSGQRIYMNQAELGKKLSNRMETVVVSTSNGLMSGSDAKKKQLGGEVLFKIW